MIPIETLVTTLLVDEARSLKSRLTKLSITGIPRLGGDPARRRIERIRDRARKRFTRRVNALYRPLIEEM